MKKRSFVIPFYKVSVTLLQIEGAQDEKAVLPYLRKVKASKEGIDYMLDGIRNGAVNGGDTYRDLEHKQMIVFFYPMENELKRAEIYSHEKRHIEDRVLQFFRVDDIESAGLLAGYLGEQFYKFERL